MPLTPIVVKEYTALLNQTGSNAPTAHVEKNTIGNIVWTRDSQGVYVGTLTGAFTENKTSIIMGNTIGQNTVFAADMWDPPNAIYVQSYSSNVSDDGLLINTPIKIEIYL